MTHRYSALLRNLLFIATTTLILTACGGGGSTESNPEPRSDANNLGAYNGPQPNSQDVQRFRINLWENIRGTDRCGSCHVPGGQSPYFARSDNVNDAYDAAIRLVNLSNPATSRLVEKVGQGHNCWLNSDQACADIMTTWIENWAGGSSAGGREILLVPPAIRPPGESKNFPDSPVGYGAIHNLLTRADEGNCGRCHSSEAETPISPYFGSADINESYEAAKSKINLDDPAESRFVVRLRDEFHNCWTSCDADADEMQAAIEAFAGPIQTNEVDRGEVIFSSALQLGDGIVASGGNRYEANQVAFWEFKTGTGNVAYDTSGVDPAIDLTISGDVEWVGGWGINIKDGKAQGSTTDSRKLYNTIAPIGEFAIEAWVAPANVTQDDAYIISYSGSNTTRNFTLGQTLYNYDFLTRSSNAGPDSESAENGLPALSTADADEVLQATLQHVVVNFDPVNGRSIYVNGVWTGDLDATPGGNLSSWRNNFAFVLGDETSNERQWQGVIRMVAVHNRVLTAQQIQQNYDVGVGEKFFLLFYLGDVLTDIAEPYLLVEVSQYDSHSYLFNEPRFISLDPTVDPGQIDIAGIRIGVNGRLPEVGQGFQKIDTRDPGFPYPFIAPEGQLLSRQGTIIALEKGPQQDEFFLAFDVLGDEELYYTDSQALNPGTPPDVSRGPDIGLRTFEEVNATLETLTTVSRQEANVWLTYDRVRQQLPTAENAGGFLAAHQMAVAQLAIEYCNALVEDPVKRSAYWPNITFPATMDGLFGPGSDRSDITDPLTSRISLPDSLGQGLNTQPDIADIEGELNSLITNKLGDCYNMTTYADSCEAFPPPPGESSRADKILKGVCAAAAGSAGMLIQ